MTHTWSTDSYATYPQIHPGRGGRGAGDSVNGWGRKRVSLQPVVHRQPVSWPEEHDVTISVGVLGAGGGLLGLNWSEHASSRKGGGVFHLSRHPSFSGASLDWAAPLLSVGFGCWSCRRSSCWAPFPVCRQAATRNPTEGNGSAPVLGVLGKQLLHPQRDVLARVGFPGCGLVIAWCFCPVWSYNSFITLSLSSAHSIFFIFFCTGEQKL